MWRQRQRCRCQEQRQVLTNSRNLLVIFLPFVGLFLFFFNVAISNQYGNCAWKSIIPFIESYIRKNAILFLMAFIFFFIIIIIVIVCTGMNTVYWLALNFSSLYDKYYLSMNSYTVWPPFPAPSANVSLWNYTHTHTHENRACTFHLLFISLFDFGQK